MDLKQPVSRRRFVGGVAATFGALGLRPDPELFAQGRGQGGVRRAGPSIEEYDSFAKLANNENNYGPPESVMKAMTGAWKYANRYGYPDGNIVQAIAEHHGVKPENVMLAAGSGEMLDVVGTTFLLGGKKVLGVDPSYGSVYQHATSIKSDAIKLPLTKDYRQDMSRLIEAANTARCRTRIRLSLQSRTTRPASIVTGEGSQAVAQRAFRRTCRS